ncbi:MAG: hypothetical protein H7338_10110, partial [Candidatus Sericytochromatia bacterium]|nr:hypothetical protein [Candidatus Sericytochromatia bacterium]
TNKWDGPEAAEFGTIGAVMGQGPTAFGQAVKGNKDNVSLGAFKSYVKRSFANEFKSIDADKNGIIAGNELQSLAQRFPNTAVGTWDSGNTGYVSERRYMQGRANQLAAA